jgi:hypothetical protein
MKKAFEIPLPSTLIFDAHCPRYFGIQLLSALVHIKFVLP